MHNTPAPRISGRSYSHLGECNGVRCQSIQGDAGVHPLRGERQNRPSSAEFGEGSSAQPTPDYTEVSLLGGPCRPPPRLGKRGRSKSLSLWRPLQNAPRPRICRRVLIPLLGERVGVRGLPRNQPRVTQRSPRGRGLEPAPDAIRGTRSGGRDPGPRVAASVKQPTEVQHRPPGPPLFTLSKGRGRFGEGSSWHPPLAYATVSLLRDRCKPPPRPRKRGRSFSLSLEGEVGVRVAASVKQPT